MDRLIAAIRSLGAATGVDAIALMRERRPDADLTRAAAVSLGGATRLLAAADGWIAVSLARPDDVELIPAWLGVAATASDCWTVVEREVASRPAAQTVARGRLLGLAAAVLGERLPPTTWHGLPVAVTVCGEAAPLTRPPRVVNMSSLWAGPLAARILADAGATVTTLASITGDPDALREMLLTADVVVEGSRPRALEQLGIDACEVAGRGPQVWLSITGYGRAEPDRNWIGFGDDAAVAGGLVTWVDGKPGFFADAAADPLTGITGAAAVNKALALGGRWLIDCNLAGVAAHVAGAA